MHGATGFGYGGWRAAAAQRMCDVRGFGLGFALGVVATVLLLLIWMPRAARQAGERPLRPGSQTERSVPQKPQSRGRNLVAQFAGCESPALFAVASPVLILPRRFSGSAAPYAPSHIPTA